ncbi:MAG: ABC transporter permease [bacterium]
MTSGIQAATLQQATADRRRLRGFLTRAMLLGPAMLFLTLVYVVGLLYLFRYSFNHYTGTGIERTFSAEAYARFLTDPFYHQIMGEGFRLGGVTTVCCLLIGYPVAYAVSRLRDQRLVLVSYVVIFSPLLVSVIVRSYGWMLLLARTGIVNYVLLRLNIIAEPLHLLYDFFGVAVALVHVLLPFAIFPIASVFDQFDPALKDAAADLGADRLRTFWHVTFPLSLPGLVSAFQLTFVLSMTAYVTPRLLGGGRVTVMPILIYESLTVLNWPLTAVMSIALLAVVLTLVFFYNELLVKHVYSRMGLGV